MADVVELDLGLTGATISAGAGKGLRGFDLSSMFPSRTTWGDSCDGSGVNWPQMAPVRQGTRILR